MRLRTVLTVNTCKVGANEVRGVRGGGHVTYRDDKRDEGGSRVRQLRDDGVGAKLNFSGAKDEEPA